MQTFTKLLRQPALCAILLAFSGQTTADALTEGNAEAGKTLYWQGLGANGAPVQAIVGDDIKASGEQFSCVNCHRPSGFGSSEGGKYVPPVTGPLLFAPRELNRNRIYTKLFEEAQPTGFTTDVRKPRMRPAYTEQSLAGALRDGIDPAGRRFDPQMPRYQLDDNDAANLAAYLKTLSAAPSPGVDSKDIQFATVVSDGIAPGERAAQLNTLNAFVEWMNRATHGYQSRPGFSPYHMSELASAFRHWQLHVWELHGAADTWPQQLADYYAKQPVFAVISGQVKGPWQPVAQFCDTNRVPCVFPNTELPAEGGAGDTYSLYFSRGLALEGDVLAQYLSQKPAQNKRLAMLAAADAYGSSPAGAFKQAVEKTLPDAALETRQFTGEADFEAELNALKADKKTDALIIWPGEHIDFVLGYLAKHPPQAKAVALPSDALAPDRLKTISDKLAKKLVFTYPYELPSVYQPRIFRVRQWMHAQHLDITEPQLQFQTYYALTLAEFALDQILDDFYRDYFIEAIEHLAENNLDNGTHPSLALGPGQRFASKGAYVVAKDPKAPGEIKALSNWLVP